MKHRIAALVATLALTAVASGQALVSFEARKLLPSNGTAGGRLGISVAVEGTIAAVGATQAEVSGVQSGAVYVFDTASGQELLTIVPDDAEDEDLFGNSVSISNGILFVGSPGDDDGGSFSGAAYLFDLTTGQQLQKLVASDGAAGDSFGGQVALENNIGVVSSRGDDGNATDSGSVYVFDTTTGQQLQKIVPSDGAFEDFFGIVAISNGIIIVGVPNDDDNGRDAGSAYLFDAETGQLLSKLFPNDPGRDDQFGRSVDISGNIAVVGAQLAENVFVNSGTAYTFDVATGQQLARFVPSRRTQDSNFGRAVSIENETVIVGARFQDGRRDGRGIAFRFDARSGQQMGILLASDRADDDEFASSVAVAGDTAVIGAIFDDDNGSNSGSAYVFDVPARCPADLSSPASPGTPDGVLTGADFFEFLARFSAGDLSMDFSSPTMPGTPDLLLTGADFFQFLTLFSQGC